METYNTWVRLFELRRYYSWIIDRFHISTRAYQLVNHGKDYDFRWLEERLDALGFHLVLCVRTPESFEQARNSRLKVSGKPSQYENLQVFVQEQELMRYLIDESLLPTLVLDISDSNIDRAANRIADWMTQTGGLWAK
jgi:thymidylate kinase